MGFGCVSVIKGICGLSHEYDWSALKIFYLTYPQFLALFSDRILSFRSSEAFPTTEIAFGNDTPRWRFLKKQVIAAVKQHGDGLKHLETMTLKHGNQMIEKIHGYAGKAFDPGRLIDITIAHLMLVLIFGHSTEELALEFRENEYKIETVLRPAGEYLILDIAPVLRYVVPSVKKVYKKFINQIRTSFAQYDRCIEARRKLYKHPKVEVFIDHFLKLNITNKTEDSTTRVDEADIRTMAMDIFGAGFMTTSRTFEMMLAILANHPQIQDIMFEEIDQAIGKRQPRMEDKISMPYTQAVILETLRYHSLAMFTIPHRATCDAQLQGFFIPKGTYIFVNLWKFHHDSRYWQQPWKFNPNRFIEDGKVVAPDHVQKQRLLPFGAGRRQCAGEVFARNRLFILTAMMLQKFKFIPAQGHPKPNHDPRQCTADILLLMKPYKLSVQTR